MKCLAAPFPQPTACAHFDSRKIAEHRDIRYRVPLTAVCYVSPVTPCACKCPAHVRNSSIFLRHARRNGRDVVFADDKDAL